MAVARVDSGNEGSERHGQPGRTGVPPASRWNRSLGSLGHFLRLPLFVVDAEGNLAYFNEAAEPLLGGPYAELGPLPAEEWSTLWAPTDVEGTPLPFERLPIIVALRERRPMHGWLRIVGLDGVRRPIEATAFPVEGPDGTVEGAAALFWEQMDL
jgi:PAS domain-containing protein